MRELEEVLEEICRPTRDKLLGKPWNLHESDVPDIRSSLDMIPTLNPWQGCIQDHHPTNFFRIETRKSVGHHSAKIVPRDVRSLEPELLGQPMQDLRHIRRRVA